MAKAAKRNIGPAANVGYEAELWRMADAFEAQHMELEAEKDQGADPEDPDEYRALNIFWVPPEARWSHLKAQAKQSTIGQLVDDAMAGIERDNPSLKGVLPKDYARKLGRMVDRTHRELTNAEIARIAGTYHAWRGEQDAGDYADIPGFCKSATLEDIRKHGHVLTPGHYVGAEAQEDDGEPFEEKMRRLTAQLREQQAEARRLDQAIAANLRYLGFSAEDV